MPIPKKRTPDFPLDWSFYKAVVVYWNKPYWKVDYHFQGIEFSSGSSSFPEALLMAERDAAQIGAWVVEYDKEGKRVKDTRPWFVRAEFCADWFKLIGAAQLTNAVMWLLAVVVTAWVTVTVERNQAAVSSPVVEATAPENESTRAK